MIKGRLFPDYIFESSWEVCNKVGGIYTVLSTRAKTLQDRMRDHIIFIGPDCWKDKACPFFKEDDMLFSDWRKQTTTTDLHVKIGRWKIPGEPIAILVDFVPYFAKKDQIYAKLWEDFQVDSLHAYGDYDEASMFSYAAAKVVESFYHFYLEPKTTARGKKMPEQKIIYHGNEWMTGLGVLYIRKYLPQIATVFTTHATSIGRSIAGNNKPLYQYLSDYNGDQMAGELNMQSKHSIEKQTALNVDCFTTVSEITATECEELLDKKVDVVLPNGFDNSFVPAEPTFTEKRKAARKRLLQVANCLTGAHFDDDTFIISTNGRYEFRNKGLDVFIESMNRLRNDARVTSPAVAFIEVPGWVNSPRQDLQERLATGKEYDTPLDQPYLTHWLNNMNEDRTLGMLHYLNYLNRPDDKVKVIFVPVYLLGDDGIMNLSFYDLLLGNDLCIYPSYYEPWGYTPLEAIAFSVPCVTTDLAGFGLWANSEKGTVSEIEDGVAVVHRTDYNYNEVCDAIRDSVVRYYQLSCSEKTKVRKRAERLSQKALWSHFIKYYEQAYDFALRKALTRNN